MEDGEQGSGVEGSEVVIEDEIVGYSSRDLETRSRME